MRRLVIACCLALGLALGVVPAFAQSESTAPPSAEQMRPGRPSGFWTSPYPAKTPYRWRLLGIGGVLALGTGLVMWRLMKRASAERAARKS